MKDYKNVTTIQSTKEPLLHSILGGVSIVAIIGCIYLILELSHG